tara:strand:+ start:23528 stop:23869 length:342 start_codon:yes stop_codon:yes gene_type:complete
MPTYDYVCKACKHQLEIFQSMSEGAKRKCPECGKLALQRLIGTGGGVIFKGGGFWQTDYRSESYKAGEKADKPATDAPKPSEAKADAKPAAKKDGKATPPAGPSPKSKPDTNT